MLKGGRSLERSVSLRSGAHVAGRARSASATRCSAIDVGAELVGELLEPGRTSPSSRCTAATARTAPCRSCSRRSAFPTPARGPAACVRCTDKVLAKQPDARGRHPDAASTTRFSETRSASWERRGAIAAVEADLGFPLVVKPALRRLRAGRQVRAHRARSCPGALVGAFSYDARGADRALRRGPRPRGVGARRRGRAAPLALPVVEAVPREEDFYDYESRYEIGMTTFVCPAELPAETTARAQELASRSTRCSAAAASPAST